MAFQPVEDTVEIDVIYTLNGEIVQNVFYAKLEGGYVLTDLEDLAEQMDAVVAANWRPEQPIEAVYLRVEVRGLAVPNDLLATNDDTSSAGLDASAALPNNVTFSIKKTSGLTGRSARGRCYWIGIPRDKTEGTDENRLTAAYVDDIVENIDQVRSNINGVGDWEAVLVSRFADGLKRDEGVTFPWLGTVAVDVVIDTQRNRLPK